MAEMENGTVDMAAFLGNEYSAYRVDIDKGVVYGKYGQPIGFNHHASGTAYSTNDMQQVTFTTMNGKKNFIVARLVALAAGLIGSYYDRSVQVRRININEGCGVKNLRVSHRSLI